MDTSTSSVQSYVDYASQFFQALNINPQAQKGSKKTTVLTLDDVVSIASKSSSVEDAISSIGQQGQKYIFDQFKDALKTEVAEAATAKDPGFFSSLFKWVGDSKIGRTLGFGTEAVKGGVAVVTGVAEGAATAEAGVAATAGSSIMTGIGALYGAYDLIANFGSLSPAHGAVSGLAVGAGIGSIIPGVGTAIGGLVGAAVGGLMSLFKKSGKDKDQKARDMMRSALQQNGIIDEKFTIGLADGARYDIGIDGGPKAEFGGRRPFDVDMKDPLMVKIATFFTPLAQVICGGNQKLASDLVGYLANAALSNAGGDEAKARGNVQAIYSQFKMKPEQILQGLSQLAGNNAIPSQLAKDFVGVLKDVFGENASINR